jgi:hypothetical protein
MRDLRLPPWCAWDLRSFGILGSVEWKFLAEVSGLVGPDILSRNVSKELPFYVAWHPKRAQISVHKFRVCYKGRTGSLHLGPCIRALCAPHWNSFLQSSPEALRTYRRERPLLAREGNWREFSQQPVIHCRSWDFWHGTDYFIFMLRIFHIGKNPTASVGFEPANSGTRG